MPGACNGASALAPLPVYERVVGRDTVHAVVAGETLGQIANGFHMKMALVLTMNQLSNPDRLHIGQRLRVSNRHIVPTTVQDGAVINLADRRLYWLRDGAVVDVFPVGVGRVEWRTPPGHYTIVSRRRDPVWHVPPSIQREMRAHGEVVKTKVLPGPDNPLGKYWLQLSAGGYGIHGTNAPWSVGKQTTHGCIRLRAEDIERLYHELPNDTVVDIVDAPIKLARLDAERILLEAHRDAAAPDTDRTTHLAERLEAAGVLELVDLAAAKRVVADAWGVAIDVTKRRHPTRGEP